MAFLPWRRPLGEDIAMVVGMRGASSKSQAVSMARDRDLRAGESPELYCLLELPAAEHRALT